MIRLDVDGRGWETLGAGAERGVQPAGVAPAWDAWGPSSLTFNLARDPAVAWPDLVAGTPLEYAPYDDVDAPAWSGFIQDTPAAGEDGLTVNARGWQYALDDKAHTDTYVITDLSKWADTRSIDGVRLYDGTAGYGAAGQVSTGAGIAITVAQGTVLKFQSALGVTLDLGPLSRRAKSMQVDVSIPAVWSVPSRFFLRGSDSAEWFGGGYEDGTAGGGIAPAVGSVTLGTIFTTSRRFVHFFRWIHEFTATTTVEEVLRITGIRVWTDEAYRSGNASALKASHVVKRAVTRVPVLSQDTSKITDTAFSIPSFGGVNEERTPRQEVEQVNSYHRYIARVRADRRLEFRPRFSAATLVANTRRPGIDWQDASLNSLEEVWNEVTVKGKTGAGADLALTRRSTDIGVRNILDRRGRVKAKTLTVNAPTDLTVMQQLADVWLTRYARTPLKGTLTITGPALLDLTGQPIAAGHIGERVAELVLLSNLVDPDTGAHGREAVTAGATYNELDDVATIAIDNTRDDLEGLLARMDVVASG